LADVSGAAKHRCHEWRAFGDRLAPFGAALCGARLIEAQAVEKLARSIERDGQIVPCVVVGASPDTSEAKDGERLVLIDGYRRVAALRRLGRDRAFVERWPCDLAEALLGVLARAQNRSFAAIEEALLLRELTQGLGVSRSATV
jgi:ParB family transcriptional regulator, chromosome partitioning protein